MNTIVQSNTMDAGMKSFFSGIYTRMSFGLLLTAILAWLSVTFEPLMSLLYVVNPEGQVSTYTILGWIVLFAPLALILFVPKDNPKTSGFLFWAVASLTGLSLGSIFLLYTATSLISTFLIAAIMFGSLSVYGYTTSRDLSPIGKFLFMALIGLVVVSIVNIFLGNSLLHFLIGIVGVLVFAGLTAYDTQKLKNMYDESHDSDSLKTLINMGALTLYLDFINLFLMLLRLFGQRK